MTQPASFHGIHAATVCPMRADFSIHEDALAAHVSRVAETPGIRGLLINGHAGENFVLCRDEARRVIEVVRSVVPKSCWLTAGINAESSLEAARLAADAERAGADALLVFPPNSWALHQDLEMVLSHHRHVLAASALPLMLYQAPVGAGRMAYPPDVLSALIDEPRVVAIKEGSWEVATYEQNWRHIKARRPDIAVLGSGDEHLMTSYLVGSDGAQVSLAAVVPGLIVELQQTVDREDWQEVRSIHERIYPLSVAIYRNPPANWATARLKACLKMLGRIPDAAVRPPVAALDGGELATLRKALGDSGTTSG